MRVIFGPDFVVSSSHMLLTPLSKKLPFSGFVRIFRLRNINQRTHAPKTRQTEKSTKLTQKLLILGIFRRGLDVVALCGQHNGVERVAQQYILSRSENLGTLASRFFANKCGHKSRMLVASDFRHRIKLITRNLAA
jgi:hypothetical protein